MKPVTDPNILAQLNGGIETNDGLKPVSDPSILAQLNGEQPEEKGFWAKTGDNLSNSWQSLKSAVKGNAEFEDAGNFDDFVNSLPLSRQIDWGIKSTLSDIFGNEQDVIKRLKELDPNVEIYPDKNGNTMFKDRAGKQYYINTPGLDYDDVLNFGTQAATYGAGGVLTAPIKGGMKRVGATALTEGGINAATQKIAGRDELDGGEVATSALIGGAFEAFAPYVGKLVTKVKNKLTGSQEAIKAGRAVAAGRELTDDQFEAIGRMRALADDSVPDDAIIAEVEHGLKLSKGQKTGDLLQLSKEQQLREKESLIKSFKKVDDYNQNQVESLLREQRAKIHGNVDDVLRPAESGEVAYDALVAARDQAKQQYKDAYKQVDGLFVKSEAAQGLDERLVNSVYQSGTRLSDRATPKSMEAIEIIKEGQAKLGKGVKGFSLDAYDTQRKQINSLFSKQMDGTDKRALTTIKNELDNWFYSSVDEQLLSGNPEALKQLQKARGLMTEYSKRFNTKEGANKVITKILSEDRTPEDFTSMLLGVNAYQKQNAGNLVKVYKEAVGADSEGFKALKAHVFEKLILGRGIDQTGKTNLKGYQGLVSAFNDAFENKGTTMMKELFTQDEAVGIKSLMRSINKLITPKELANPSGSGKYMARLMSEYGNKIPILSSIYNTGKDVIKYANTRGVPIKSTPIGVNTLMGASQASKDESALYR